MAKTMRLCVERAVVAFGCILRPRPAAQAGMTYRPNSPIYTAMPPRFALCVTTRLTTTGRFGMRVTR